MIFDKHSGVCRFFFRKVVDIDSLNDFAMFFLFLANLKRFAHGRLPLSHKCHILRDAVTVRSHWRVVDVESASLIDLQARQEVSLLSKAWNLVKVGLAVHRLV